jgi:glutathione S-transferase
MLKIYGVPGSRARRTLWMAEECGLQYELVRTNFLEESKRPSYLAVNPNGRIPTIDDDGLIVWESMAINLYLAKKYGTALAPKDVAEEAHALQWSFWGATEIEKTLLAAMFARTGFGGVSKDEAEALRLFGELKRPFDVLESHLRPRPYLLGDRFTVADLNVSVLLFWVEAGRFDLAPWPKIADWFNRCVSRPACMKARALK